MRKHLVILLALAFIMAACSVPSPQGTAELRIVQAPQFLSVSLSSPSDVQGVVSVENFSEVEDYSLALATAYLDYYEVALYVQDSAEATIKVPARAVIQPGATVDISTMVVTREMARDLAVRYGTSAYNLMGKAEVRYHFKDGFGNEIVLTWTPILHFEGGE